MFKHHRILIIISISVIVFVLFLGWLKRPKPVDVIIASVEQGDVQRTVTNTRAGTLKACRRAGLSPAMGGQIARLPVREGDKVTKGEVLLEIWNDDLVAQVALAKSEILSNQSRIKEACVIAKVAKREAGRLTKLQKKGLAADDRVEQIVGEAQAKQAACQAAKSLTEVSRSRLAVAKAALERTQLKAPFDGTVAEITGELGEFVTPSPVGVLTLPAVDIIDNSCLYVLAPIDEVDAPEIKTGMSARISLDAYTKKFFKGKVRRIAPYILDREKQARTVDIEVNFILDKSALNMLPGYSADVEIILNSHSNVIRIPTESLLEGQKVFVYDADDQIIYEKEVRVGLSNWKYTEILNGLKKGEQVVTSIDRDGVIDGALVRVKSE
ncbi:Probable Co/Zn/Cd efflux system membrane fusion protein [hydrothermal vent metagenome]|uniref:Probable Co/Zn/Cd efflux system membrane fusion protein n=1 Tax=hydrothermal vent metagenome TaxID=652676 RepID=A0A3B0ZMW3_9ZZZZ